MSWRKSVKGGVLAGVSAFLLGLVVFGALAFFGKVSWTSSVCCISVALIVASLLNAILIAWCERWRREK